MECLHGQLGGITIDQILTWQMFGKAREIGSHSVWPSLTTGAWQAVSPVVIEMNEWCQFCVPEELAVYRGIHSLTAHNTFWYRLIQLDYYVPPNVDNFRQIVKSKFSWYFIQNIKFTGTIYHRFNKLEVITWIASRATLNRITFWVISFDNWRVTGSFTWCCGSRRDKRCKLAEGVDLLIPTHIPIQINYYVPPDFDRFLRFVKQFYPGYESSSSTSLWWKPLL